MSAGLKKDAPNNVVPLFSHRVVAGFPSMADDHIEARLDLNEHLIKHPAATFFVRVMGQSMMGAGIFDQDLVLIDRSLVAKNNNVVLAILNGEFTLKRLVKKKQELWLYPENVAFQAINVSNDAGFEIWGVATHVIHSL